MDAFHFLRKIMRDYEVYFDGQWLKYADAKLPLLTHALHYGFGVFEGVRAYPTSRGAAIFRLQDHTARLLRSAHILDLEVKQTLAELNAAQLEILRRNQLQSAYLRPLIFLGEGNMSLDPKAASVHVMIAAWPWQNIHHQHAEGIHILSVPYQRQSGAPELLQAKAIGHYLTSGMALQTAKRQGANEALLLDPDNFVCEASGQNIFMVKDKKLVTPASKYALDGITRASVLKIAQDLGIAVEEKLFTLEELYQADAMFLTGTASELVPVLSVDGRVLNSKQHPMVQTLMKNFTEIVLGERLEYRNWLSYVG